MPGYRLYQTLRRPTVIAGASGAEQVSRGASGSYIVSAGIHKIKHVIIVMQENRSFETYFGTYPEADGIPMANGTPTVCVPNPAGLVTRGGVAGCGCG